MITINSGTTDSQSGSTRSEKLLITHLELSLIIVVSDHHRCLYALHLSCPRTHSRCCPGNSLILSQTDVLELGFLYSRLALYWPLFTITFRFWEIEAFSGFTSEAPLLTAVSMWFTISFVFERRCGVRHVVYTQSAAPTSFPGLFLVQNRLNSPKVFQKVARSCSLTKKLLKILKVAENLPTRIWTGVMVKQMSRNKIIDYCKKILSAN